MLAVKGMAISIVVVGYMSVVLVVVSEVVAVVDGGVLKAEISLKGHVAVVVVAGVGSNVG